jgi:hypothetical protein
MRGVGSGRPLRDSHRRDAAHGPKEAGGEERGARAVVEGRVRDRTAGSRSSRVDERHGPHRRSAQYSAMRRKSRSVVMRCRSFRMAIAARRASTVPA